MWVIISQIKTNGFLGGLRWRIVIAFLLIIGISFYYIATSLIVLVGNYLFEQRMSADRVSIEKLSLQLAPLLSTGESWELQNILQQAGSQLGGRLLIVDRNAKVQFDGYSECIGIQLQLPEILSILRDGQVVDYGVHKLSADENIISDFGLFSIFRPVGHQNDWIAYSAAALVNTQNAQTEGALLYSSSVREMMTDLNNLQGRMLIYFIAVATAVMVMAFVFSRIITKPIINMTRVIQKMGKGDLTARVKVKGSGELRRLAQTFNHMSERLEALDISRNQFVANASHELKTPLATMKIMLESMIYQPDMESELRAEFMTDINNEINRLSHVISDLLSLVQIDTRSMQLNREDIDFSEIVRNAVRKLMPIAQDRHQIITVNAAEACLMYADGLKLTQVVYNLIDNAVKYTQPAGQIAVTLTKNNKEAFLTVQDNGPGVPPEDQAQIFDRFYRVDKARSRETGGTGLGLSIVSQIVQLHGGTVSVKSEVNIGSTFRVELPMHRG